MTPNANLRLNGSRGLWRWAALLGALGVLCSGCKGKIAGRGTADGGASGATAVGARFSCQPNATPAELPLRRLSQAQYANSIRALVKRFAPTSGTDILTVIEPLLAQLPEDQRVGGPNAKRGGFTRLDQTVQQGHIDFEYKIATTLGQQFTSSPARITEVFGACAAGGSSSGAQACLDSFVQKFGSRTLRHPLGQDDVTFYETPVGSGSPLDPAVLSDVAALILSAPAAFYFEEHGQAGSTAVRIPLDAYELASRLSFHFWNEPPDDALWLAAQSGALLTSDGYQAQVDRLFQDARALASLNEFFGEWLRLYELPAMNGLNGDAQFQAFAGGNLPDSNTTGAMVNDVLSAVSYEARHGGGVSELLTDARSFARDPVLAAIYGVPAWDGSSAPPATGRAGLLTRPAFLATGLVNTRPIMKGLLIRTALMCDRVPDPPAGAQQTPPPPLPPVSTTRDKLEALTEQQGSLCIGCHRQYLNPLGYVTENYDAIGRQRTVQKVFDISGNLLGSKPVNTAAVLNLTSADTSTVADAVAATQRLDQSRKVHSCFAELYFRYTAARTDDPTQDGCALSALEQPALSNQSLEFLFKSAAQLDVFKTRSFQ